MAVLGSQGVRLGFSLHLRAEEAVAKFEKEIEDDFNYLHEILAEAKRHFGRWVLLEMLNFECFYVTYVYRFETFFFEWFLAFT